MKILYLNHNIKGEGTFFRAFNFAKKLAERGHDMTVITISPKSLFKPVIYKESGVTIIESPRFLDIERGGWGLLDILHRIFHCIGNKYDIVHGFDHKPNVYFPLLTSKLFHKQTILFSDWADWWMKGGIASDTYFLRKITLNPIETFLEEDVRRRVSGLTVTSKELEKRALSIGIRKDRIFYIPSGCATDKIKPISAAQALKTRKKLGISLKSFVMEFIGFGQVDLGVLLDAFFLLKDRKTNIVFIIVGPLDKKFEKTINESRYNKDIIITGKIPFEKVAQYASVADVFMMPLSDTIANRARGPIKAGDYMAAGKPMIANNIGDVGSWINKYKAGLLVRYDAGDFAAKIEILMKRKTQAAIMGRNARKTAEIALSWGKLSGDMEKAYTAVTKKHP